MYLSLDVNLCPPPPPPLQKISLGANDGISILVHVLSFECCAMLRTFECRDSLLWTVADRLFIQSLKSVLTGFKILAGM